MTTESTPSRPGVALQSSVPFGPILASTSWASIRGVKSNAEGSESHSNSNANERTDKNDKSSTSMIQENPNTSIATLTTPAEMPPSQKPNDPEKDLQADLAASASEESIDTSTTVGKSATEQNVDDSRQKAPATLNESDSPEFQLSKAQLIENCSAGAEQLNPSSTAPIASASGAAIASTVVSTVEGIAQFGNFVSNGNTANPSTIAGNGNANQQAIKSAQGKNSGMFLPADSKSTILAGTAKQNLASGGEASFNGGQSSGQGSQHPEAGSTAPLVAQTAASNSAALAMSSNMASHATPHQTSFPDSVRNDNGGTSLPTVASGKLSSDQLNSGMATVPGGINTARLIQSMSESEMCVGMHSVEFGEISVRTSVSQQQMLAQISTEHVDLGAAISAHIPSIQEKLGNDYGLHASIQVNQGGASFSNERGRSSQREQRASVLTLEPFNSGAPAEIERLTARVPKTSGDGYRLDIRA